jgi:hypothetical protein
LSESDKDKPQGRSGRVRHDSGGRAVWEWAVDSGRHALDSTSRLLKKLDLSSLTLVKDDEKSWDKKHPGAADDAGDEGGQPRRDIPTFGGPAEVDPQGKRRSYNPYDSRNPATRRAPGPAAPSAPPKTRVTQPVRPAPPAKKPGLLGRLFGRDKP